MNQKIFVLFALSLSLVSCMQSHELPEEITLAGAGVVTKDTLYLGKTTYMEYCFACHGVNGDGKGVASKGLIPPPRDFTQGIYKFGWVMAGDLPTDDDFKRIIRKGLHGTAMLKWDIGDKRLNAVIQYLKTFAPKVWKGSDKKVGKWVDIGADPYTIARKSHAIAKGAEVYHSVAMCQTCHRAYGTKAELSRWNQKYNGEPLTEFDQDMYKLKTQESEFGVNTLPPDFTWHEVRSADTVSEIALRVAAGVSGTAMPAWKDTIEDNEIWAVSYYIRSLMDLKHTPGRASLMRKLEN